MKAFSLLLALLLSVSRTHGQTTLPEKHRSLKGEIQLAFQRGLSFLKSRQNAETGAWGEAEPIAFTGLALASLMVDPNRLPSGSLPTEMEKGYAFLLKNVQPDGGIYVQARANYNTSLALLALSFHPEAKGKLSPVIKGARRYLIGRQMDLDTPGTTDNPLDGGIGYGDDKGSHADLSNTHFVLEALKAAETVLADTGSLEGEPKLNFNAAITFIERCQNRPESNKAEWVSTDPKEHGGFIYGPTETRGPKVDSSNGRVAMRSYGSISYAGLMSFIYAGLNADDPRVKAAITWLSENYTLEENPGMGAQGQYYYFHTMAKSLRAAELSQLVTKDGKKIDWCDALSTKLLNLQQSDGSWVNSNAARWMENDPVLVTEYSLMALGHVYHSLGY
jgi:squalene-hopene/tetraprenyl-beta-curcumene cyclase